MESVRFCDFYLIHVLNRYDSDKTSVQANNWIVINNRKRRRKSGFSQLCHVSW